ncbi:MAG: N-acetylglucosamine-6-phosphate deacetylase [Clostridia bacterium]|nr:N-acetylglucosamine-6-phosphate deacetylase [Clostridia bacterium]MBR5365556.1 N-acetylglucosamine-6-phosphate deacetylase [Clostridia bacterium]
MFTLFQNGYVYTTAERMFRKADLLAKDGVIVDPAYTGPLPDGCTVVDCTGRYLLPGMVDVHTHGRSGYDFNNVDDAAVKALRRSYAKAGTTTLMATLASATMESLENSIAHIGKNRELSEGMATLAGIHLEGRYLNPKRRGAHATELLFPLDTAEFESLMRDMLPLPVHVSCAAELEGGEAFVKTAIRLGATVGMAHSDATWDEAMHAVEWGVTSFTHTFNAMKPVHHREPGNAIASLMCDTAWTELICDGEHVHPAMIALTSRAKPMGKLVLITDSMEAAAMPDGEYGIAGLPVIVKNGRAVNSDGALAGSTLDLFRGLTNFMKFTGRTLEDALPCATANPAEMVGIADTCGSLAAGRRADIVMITDKNAPAIESVWVLGKKIER